MAELDIVEIPSKEDFDKIFQSSVLIELAKLYDMLALVCIALGQEKKVQELLDMHKNGLFYCPPPAIAVDDK